jgi:hypothetical protein
MRNQPAGKAAPIVYEIRVEGCLPDRWRDWFEGMSFTRKGGETLLTGPVVDQAALYGLLRKVRDTGLTLIAVNQVRSKRK